MFVILNLLDILHETSRLYVFYILGTTQPSRFTQFYGGKKQLTEFPRLKFQFWLQAASCLVWVVKKEHRSIP